VCKVPVLVCIKGLQGCKVSLQAAWRVRRAAKCPCKLHGRFAGLQCLPAACGEGSEIVIFYICVHFFSLIQQFSA